MPHVEFVKHRNVKKCIIFFIDHTGFVQEDTFKIPQNDKCKLL